MSLVPSSHTISVKRFSQEGKDGHGNTTKVYADPVPWQVRSIDPGVSGLAGEPYEQGRDLSLVLYTIQADTGPNVPGERDRVVVNGVDLDVYGRPQDWSRGPWPNPVAGVTVRLKAAEG